MLAAQRDETELALPCQVVERRAGVGGQRCLATKVSLSLSKTGRKLVAKSTSRSVRTLVQVLLNRSSDLPHVTTVGTVTFHE